TCNSVVTACRPAVANDTSAASAPRGAAATETTSAATAASSLDAVALGSFLGCARDDVGDRRHLGHLELGRRASEQVAGVLLRRRSGEPDRHAAAVARAEAARRTDGARAGNLPRMRERTVGAGRVLDACDRPAGR